MIIKLNINEMKKKLSNLFKTYIISDAIKLKYLYLAIFFLAFVIRLIYVLTLEDKWYFYDTVHYHTAANNLLAGEGFGQSLLDPDRVTAYNLEPIYPIFLAAVYSLFGDNLLAVRIFQSLLFCLIPILVFVIAKRLFNAQIALIASVLSIFYPYFIYISGFLYSTGLMTLLILVFVYFNIKFFDNSNYYYPIVIGILMGLIALTRPIALSFFPFWILWVLLINNRKYKTRITQLILAIIFFVITLTPWTIRNHLIFEKFVPVRASAGIVDYLDKKLHKEKRCSGDEFKVIIRIDNNAHHFDCYYDNSFKGTLSDSSKLYGNQNINYSGVFLADGLKNNIASFSAKTSNTVLKDYKKLKDKNVNKILTQNSKPDIIGSEKDSKAKQSKHSFLVDDFNRDNLGKNWTASNQYKIVSHEFTNTAKSDGWNGLAVNNFAINANEISIIWGKRANNYGVNQGAIAVMLDSNSTHANGYMVWRDPKGFLRLWTIEEGHPSKFIMRKKELKDNLNQPSNMIVRVFNIIISSPHSFFQAYVSEFINFWNPGIDRVSTQNEFNTNFIKRIGSISFSIILFFGLIGLIKISGNNLREKLLLIFIMLAVALSYSVFDTRTRYRIPIDPYLIIFAANGIWILFIGINKLYKKAKLNLS